MKELPEPASSMWAKVDWKTLSTDGVNPTSPLDSIIQLSLITLASTLSLYSSMDLWFDSGVKLLSLLLTFILTF